MHAGRSKHFGWRAAGDTTPANSVFLVRSQVLTAASMKMAVFWDAAPCSVVEDYRRFRGAMIALMMAVVSMLQFILQWLYSCMSET
jgi:hypothetical protein